MWREINRCTDYDTWGYVCDTCLRLFTKGLGIDVASVYPLKVYVERKERGQSFGRSLGANTCGILMVKKIGMQLDHEEMEVDIYTADECVARGEGGSSE